MNLTERAITVLNTASEEAELAGCCYTNTGHILLGLAKLDGGIAKGILAILGITEDAIRKAMREIQPSFL